MNIWPRCFLHPKGMWLIMAATVAACACFPANLSSTVSTESLANTTSSTYHQLSTLNFEGTRDDSANVTHSYGEETTLNEGNTTITDIYNVASNTIDDQLIEVTSSLRNTICAICAGFDYNVTEISNVTTNSSGYILSSVAKNNAGPSFFNVGIIIAIAVLVMIILGIIGGLSFFAYRHFAWNRPQTLTDKFSNDESTGYIDDTAFRENSEEMYSLDNDSFLNSLEAMTIQNYWTDHVRHTKL